ncbi:MAG TPA: TadE family protein [Pyrinomonadaceae bacterium]
MLRKSKNERGATLVEFAIGATVFVMSLFAVLEFGRALWVHNALTDAARRGARYAVLHSINSDTSVTNVVVYGDPTGGTKPIVPDLNTGNVEVTYSSDFVVNQGTATVKITNYQFQFVLPFLPSSITMPSYSTTLTAESAGFIP